MIRRIVLYVAALLCLATLASAQSPISGFPPGTFDNLAAQAAGGGGGGCGGGPVVGTFRNGPAAQGSNNVFTFAAQPIGTADTCRVVAVAVEGRKNVGNTVTMTIGGLGTTCVGEQNDGSAFINLCYVVVPTGTTADVVVNVSVFASSMQIAVYTITGSQSVPSNTGVTAWTGGNPTTMSVTATVPASGFGIAAFGLDRNVSVTWSNATLDFEQTDGQGQDMFALSTTTSGSVSPTSSSTTTNYGAVMAAWGP